MHACDSDALSILAATKNLKKTGTTITLSDAWTVLTDQDITYDIIISNPPVHDLHGRNSFVVVKELILSAKNKLRKENGMLWLVTQNYIPVGMLYNETDWKSCECYSDGRFTVWKLTTGKKVVSKVLEDVNVIVGDKRKADELQDSEHVQKKLKKENGPTKKRKKKEKVREDNQKKKKKKKKKKEKNKK